ncbi:MAG: hypothetical protein HY741_01010 [Chloroflexi bacterium]|nr:hypothetical protein [Chloroflexota bacterium]
MQDEIRDQEYIIELIAKSLDEPLTPAEQAEVSAAMQKSLAIRVAADGLEEFDALLKRMGMAIPDEGFPLRVLLRLEAREKSHNRLQWALTLGMIFLGSLAALAWVVLNWGILISTVLALVSGVVVIVPLLFALLFALVGLLGQGPLLLYAFTALALTILWARVSGSWQPTWRSNHLGA